MRIPHDLLPAGVVIAVERSDDADLDVRAAAVGIEAYAADLHPKRQREFLAGRLAARTVLQQVQAHTLAVGRDGHAPIWPAGFCGSISHGAGLAAAIAARSPSWRSLGLDIEARIGANRMRALRFALSDDEMHICEASADPWAWTRYWSAKEAVFKCCAALGLRPTLQSLQPAWRDTGHGTVDIVIGETSVCIDLVGGVADEAMWMIASMRDATADLPDETARPAVAGFEIVSPLQTGAENAQGFAQLGANGTAAA